MEYSNEFWKTSKPYRSDFKLHYSARTTVSVVQDLLITVLIESHYDQGGNHPNWMYEPLNYAIVNGAPKKLTLDDLLAVGTTPEMVFEIHVLPRINRMKEARGHAPVTDAQYLPHDMFVITPAGLSWTFPPYYAGAFAVGEYIVKVSWRELGDMIDSKFLPNRLAP